jgi:hypothetical protein
MQHDRAEPSRAEPVIVSGGEPIEPNGSTRTESAKIHGGFSISQKFTVAFPSRKNSRWLFHLAKISNPVCPPAIRDRKNFESRLPSAKIPQGICPRPVGAGKNLKLNLPFAKFFQSVCLFRLTK